MSASPYRDGKNASRLPNRIATTNGKVTAASAIAAAAAVVGVLPRIDAIRAATQASSASAATHHSANTMFEGTLATSARTWPPGGGELKKSVSAIGARPATIVGSYIVCPAAAARPARRRSSRSNAAVGGRVARRLRPSAPIVAQPTTAIVSQVRIGGRRLVVVVVPAVG